MKADLSPGRHDLHGAPDPVGVTVGGGAQVHYAPRRGIAGSSPRPGWDFQGLPLEGRLCAWKPPTDRPASPCRRARLRTAACLSPLAAALRPRTCRPGRGSRVAARELQPRCTLPFPQLPAEMLNSSPPGLSQVRTGVRWPWARNSRLLQPHTSCRFPTLNTRESPQGPRNLRKSSGLGVRRI